MTLVARVLLAVVLPATSLGGCATGSSSSPAASGTVTGVVLSAPSCPVERAGSPCPPRPVPGAEVTATRDGTTVARVRTGRDGLFDMSLAAGAYTITARQPRGIGSSAIKDVTVQAGAIVAVTLTVDSGIR